MFAHVWPFSLLQVSNGVITDLGRNLAIATVSPSSSTVSLWPEALLFARSGL